MTNTPPTADRTIGCVLFDLDGTLADTALDLADALNTLRAEHGEAPLPFDTVRPAASHGAGALIRLGFGIEDDDRTFEALRVRFVEIYSGSLTRRTRLFPGMAELLAALEARGLKWGVVTNKPARLTEPLMAGLGLHRRAACIVSGDSTRNRKPHPAPLLRAARLAGLPAGDCLYVGDAQRDIDAGRRAGMLTLVALFGYLSAGDRPHEWQADGAVQHPREILDWLDAPRAATADESMRLR